VQSGYAEEDESQMIYLVRFEDASGELGPPIGCLPEELTQQVPAA
jgi:nitrogen fixation protein NifZ